MRVGYVFSSLVLQESSLYQDFVEVMDCNEVEVSAVREAHNQ